MSNSIENFLDNLIEKIINRFPFLVTNEYLRSFNLKCGVEKEKIENIGKKFINQKTDKLKTGSLALLNRFSQIVRRRKDLVIILTHKCNLSCAYCLRDAGIGCQDEILYSQLEKIILSSHRMGIRNAGITGGEAFLYSHWKELVELLGRLKWQILWETNGILVSEERLQFIKKNLERQIHFLVSLDSHREDVHDNFRGSGAFKNAVKGIRLIKSHGFNLRTNAIVTPFNFMPEKDLLDYVSFNKSLGVDYISFNKVVSLGRGEDQKKFFLPEEKADELCQSLKKHKFFNGYMKDDFFVLTSEDNGCARLGSEICISPQGIHPCVFLENIKLGNLDDFENLVLDSIFLKTLNIIRMASMAGYDKRYYSSAGCVATFPPYLKKLHKIELTDSENENQYHKLPTDIILPQSFSVLLTQKCNFNCDFCEFECSQNKTAAIDIADFEKLLKEGKKIGISKITLDGGEPLIYPEINKAMRLCAEYGYEVTILTNGWHFEDYLPEFQKYNIRSFIFGINGATAKTNDYIMGKEGAFERLAEAIKKSKKLGFFTGLHLVIHPLNIEELDRFFSLAKKWGVNYIMTSRIINVGRAKDNPTLYLSQPQIEEVRRIYEKHRGFLNKIQFYGAYINKERSLQCKYLSRNEHLSVHWDGQVALCSMTPLLNLPFRKIRDYSLIDCLVAMGETNKKFQTRRDEEFPSWRLSKNLYLQCEYCHEELNKNLKNYYNF